MGPYLDIFGVKKTKGRGRLAPVEDSILKDVGIEAGNINGLTRLVQQGIEYFSEKKSSQ